MDRPRDIQSDFTKGSTQPRSATAGRLEKARERAELPDRPTLCVATVDADLHLVLDELAAHNAYNGNPAQAFAHWVERAPEAFARSFVRKDRRDCLGTIKNYNALMPAAQKARKPIFELKPTDGVIGAQLTAAKNCGEDMRRLAKAICQRMQELELEGDSRSDRESDTRQTPRPAPMTISIAAASQVTSQAEARP